MKNIGMILGLFWALSAPVFGETDLSSPVSQDRPVASEDWRDFVAMDLKIAPYVAEARESYPAVKVRFLRGLPSGETFFMTVRLFDDKGRFEQVFIAVERIEGGMVTGKIANRIMLVSGYRLGQPHVFPEKQMLDWTIGKPGGVYEGNLVGKFLETQSQAFPDRCVDCAR